MIKKAKVQSTYSIGHKIPLYSTSSPSLLLTSFLITLKKKCKKKCFVFMMT